jgi:hypothetical protein
MTQFFISYSRKDVEFARKLADSLSQLGFDSWIDWNDIPLTADWWEEIKKGIETTDTFLFLISPDSVSSDACQKEIEHAVQNGKRVIPLVVRNTTWESVHPAIAKLQYVFFRPQDDYETALKKLDTAVRIDLAWVEAHRRLQVHALEWGKRKERSLLLRGDDLRIAEEQLAASGQKVPQPTDLQRRYVLTSRRSDSRTRNLVGVIFIVVALALGFAAYYSVQSSKRANADKNAAAAAVSTAEAAQAEEKSSLLNAQTQKDLARIGQLIEQSQQLAGDHSYSTSLLLALEATRLINDTGELLTESIEKPSFDALADAQGITFYANSENVTTIIYSPDKRWLASAGKDGIVRLWKLPITDSQPISLEGHQGQVNFLAFNKDSTRLASGGEDGRILIWELDDPDPSTQSINIPVHFPITSLTWEGQWLAAGLYDEGVAFINMELTDPSPEINAFRINQNNAIIIEGTTKDCIPKNEPWWDEKLSVLPGPKSCTFKVYIAEGSGDVYVAARPTGASANEPLFAAANFSEVDIWNITNREYGPRASKPASSFANFSPDGKWLATSKPDEINLWSLDPIANNPIAFKIFEEGTSGAVYGMVYGPSEDGTKWLAISDSYQNEVLLLDVSPERLKNANPNQTRSQSHFVRLVGHEGPVTALAFSPDGHWLATSSGDVVRVGTYSKIASQFNALSGDGTTRLWDLSTIKADTTSIEPSYVINTNSQYAVLAFSPDSKWLAVSSENLLVRLFDLESKNLGFDQTILERINSMGFSELSDLVCRNAGRNFTQAEWKNYFPGEAYQKTCQNFPEGK